MNQCRGISNGPVTLELEKPSITLGSDCFCLRASSVASKPGAPFPAELMKHVRPQYLKEGYGWGIGDV
jgi:hypothetical protein